MSMPEVRSTPSLLLLLALAFSAIACKKEETAQAPPPDLSGMIPYSDSGHGLTLYVPKSWTIPKRISQLDQTIVGESPGDLWLKEPWESQTAAPGVLLVRSGKTDKYSFQEIYDAVKADLLNLQAKEISDTKVVVDGNKARQFIYTFAWTDPPSQFVDVFIARPETIVRLRIAFPLALAYKYSSQADAIVKTIKFH
jgi:hypothetical protein